MKKIISVLFLLLSMVMNLKSGLYINYQRINDDYDGWSLWVWDKTENKSGFEIFAETRTSFGIRFYLDLDKYNLANKEIGLLPRYGNWEKKESFDRIFPHKGEKEIYIIEGEPKIYKSLSEIEITTQVTGAYYDENSIIRLTLNRRIKGDLIKDFYLEDGLNNSEKRLEKISTFTYSNYILLKSDELSLEDIKNSRYKIKSELGEKLLELGSSVYSIKPEEVKLGESFGDLITLRAFSTAQKLNLILKNGDKEEKKEFQYKGNFIWQIELPQSYYGWKYKYEAIYPDKTLYGIDPNSRFSYDNNKWALLKNDITEVSPSPEFDISQLVIYEMSIRDFTLDEFSGIKEKGKYLGLSENNTYNPKFPDIKTGISHLKELGINAVHIMPFYDFEKDENSDDYDWGYMPVSFNSPDGWFAKDKENKVYEVKKMIDSFHKNGIKVIMDVVYNHTAETKEKIYNFNALAYNYYYRTKMDGSYYNGSGCGNEFKSESPYGRKFIIDSLKNWVSDYKIDGFRFDLMGLIDLETVDEIIKELKKIKPDIIIYGEPWTGGETPVNGVKKGKQKDKGFAVFNDDFRDAIKGSVFNIEDLGYVQSGNYRDKVIKGIKGSIELFTNSPLETINYVSCHDNHTLFDRIKFSLKDESFDNIIKMDRVAQGIIFVSQGIPFLHSGEEILRTKFGNENSYNAGDEINKIRWNDKKNYYETFSYYRDLIKMRKEHPAFRMKTRDDIEKNIKFYEDLNIPLPDKNSIAFVINGKNVGDKWNEILVIINPNKEKKDFILPQGNWINVFNENGFAGSLKEYSHRFWVNPISIVVLIKK